jgi:hypothetical protein
MNAMNFELPNFQYTNGLLEKIMHKIIGEWRHLQNNKPY